MGSYSSYSSPKTSCTPSYDYESSKYSSYTSSKVSADPTPLRSTTPKKSGTRTSSKNNLNSIKNTINEYLETIEEINTLEEKIQELQGKKEKLETKIADNPEFELLSSVVASIDQTKRLKR